MDRHAFSFRDIAVKLAAAVALGLALLFLLASQNPCLAGCGCCPNPNPCPGVSVCVSDNCTQMCACQPGGGTTGGEVPAPTAAPGGGDPGGPAPAPTPVPLPTRPPGVRCGDGTCTAGWESCRACPADCGACPTPTPYPDWATMTRYCVEWYGCPGGFANVEWLYHEAADYWVVVDVVCLDREQCVRPTPTAGAPTPVRPGGSGWPCDRRPAAGSGIVHQECAWPGWDLSVEAVIPNSSVLVAPWPRSLAGLPTQFWWSAPSDSEAWSAEAVPCAVDTTIYTDENSSDPAHFDCGDGYTAGEGDKANVQIGVAWRRWQAGGPAVYGQSPAMEAQWTVPDRAWNGGMKGFVAASGRPLSYVFETSSWGLSPEGPAWNPECQDETCTCDERVLEGGLRESPAYSVGLLTSWWPEWTFRWDEYQCKDWDRICHGCDPATDAECRAVGECDRDKDGKNDPNTKVIIRCKAWGWEHDITRWDIDLFPGASCAEPAGSWCRYDLRPLQGSSFTSWGGVNTGGANADGTQCTSQVYDVWPFGVPVPVIELQPVK